MGAQKHKAKRKKNGQAHRRTWFLGRREAGIIAAILLAIVVIGETYIQLAGPKAASVPGWIIDGDQLQNLISYLPSSLASTYFDTSNTVALKNFTDSSNPVPNGWRSRMGNHYTSLTARGCGSGCVSLQRDITNGALNIKPKLVAMFDDEHWTRTPKAEQTNPCAAMNQFVQMAHSHGLMTILAPDQNLAQPGVNTYYQGGESENWQTYLRLGLSSCAAKTGTEWYHIMSQPFEAHWCGNLFGQCQSSESDFVNFVTQAALQARAISPNVKISDGLSTNPQYFGYFRGSQNFADIMYRDYADVRQMINSVWLNVVGPNADTTALYFLSLLGKNAHVARRSSVLFLQPRAAIQNTQPNGQQAQAFALNKGASAIFTSTQILAGDTSLPAGTGEFQFWTDGTSSQSVKINLQFGYCADKNCQRRVPIKNLNMQIHGAAQGTAVAGGAFTTRTPLKLPAHGSYHLFVRLTAQNNASFNLLYGSQDTPTNLATPVLLPLK